MIVCFYPGGCGNRFVNFINKQSYTELFKKYDGVNEIDTNQNRYLLENSRKTLEYDSIFLSHCVNITNIKKFLVDSDIIFLKTDLKNSLNRQWALENLIYNDAVHDFDFLVDSAYSTICWHQWYYQQLPWDSGNSQVIDIENDRSDFSLIVQQELLNYDNEYFNFAWDVYLKYGNNAPIIDLWLDR